MEIQRLARDMDVGHQLVNLFQYFEEFWMGSVTPAGFSVYGCNVRTNNYLESFHNTIQTTIGRHPPLWTFYGKLHKIIFKQEFA